MEFTPKGHEKAKWMRTMRKCVSHSELWACWQPREKENKRQTYKMRERGMCSTTSLAHEWSLSLPHHGKWLGKWYTNRGPQSDVYSVCCALEDKTMLVPAEQRRWGMLFDLCVCTAEQQDLAVGLSPVTLLAHLIIFTSWCTCGSGTNVSLNKVG